MGRRKGRTGVAVEAGRESVQRIPAWFGEAVLYGQYWLESGLVGYLEEEVRVVRGRMGRYEVMDFVLLLNAYAISGERTLPSARAKRVRRFLSSIGAGEGSLDEPVGARVVSIGIEFESVSWVCGSNGSRGNASFI